MKPLFLRIKDVDIEAYNAYLALIKDKQLAKECQLDLSADTLAGAFVWGDANKTEFFWEVVARKLGERKTPIFENPCDKYKKRYAVDG